ncbi:hypothetical protein BURPS1710b_3202 [Burkholderia pseudomallei 1710b]|uniref:Uncharacterized protein n=1 Tax=Burkholderia pseudomallei (strain 1710b) TaxID=320372 RepID=Q3JPC9_BURP1|nr:hypothetical protein BURPS1710b_3202 [Burkholderia pseudomallei 1710b]
MRCRTRAPRRSCLRQPSIRSISCVLLILVVSTGNRDSGRCSVVTRTATRRRAAPHGGCARCCGKAPAPGRMRTGAGRPEPAGVATGRAAAPDGRPTNALRPARRAHRAHRARPARRPARKPPPAGRVRQMNANARQRPAQCNPQCACAPSSRAAARRCRSGAELGYHRREQIARLQPDEARTHPPPPAAPHRRPLRRGVVARSRDVDRADRRAVDRRGLARDRADPARAADVAHDLRRPARQHELALGAALQADPGEKRRDAARTRIRGLGRKSRTAVGPRAEGRCRLRAKRHRAEGKARGSRVARQRRLRAARDPVSRARDRAAVAVQGQAARARRRGRGRARARPRAAEDERHRAGRPDPAAAAVRRGRRARADGRPHRRRVPVRRFDADSGDGQAVSHARRALLFVHAGRGVHAARCIPDRHHAADGRLRSGHEPAAVGHPHAVAHRRADRARHAPPGAVGPAHRGGARRARPRDDPAARGRISVARHAQQLPVVRRRRALLQVGQDLPVPEAAVLGGEPRRPAALHRRAARRRADSGAAARADAVRLARALADLPVVRRAHRARAQRARRAHRARARRAARQARRRRGISQPDEDAARVRRTVLRAARAYRLRSHAAARARLRDAAARRGDTRGRAARRFASAGRRLSRKSVAAAAFARAAA